MGSWNPLDQSAGSFPLWNWWGEEMLCTVLQVRTSQIKQSLHFLEGFGPVEGPHNTVKCINPNWSGDQPYFFSLLVWLTRSSQQIKIVPCKVPSSDNTLPKLVLFHSQNHELHCTSSSSVVFKCVRSEDATIFRKKKCFFVFFIGRWLYFNLVWGSTHIGQHFMWTSAGLPDSATISGIWHLGEVSMCGNTTWLWGFQRSRETSSLWIQPHYASVHLVAQQSRGVWDKAIS